MQIFRMMECRHMFLADMKSAPEKLLLHKDPVCLRVLYSAHCRVCLHALFTAEFHVKRKLESIKKNQYINQQNSSSKME